jgi:multidrug efflux system membrane fusion protein
VDTVDVVGTVQALNATDVRAKIAGEIIQIPFAEGKPLKKGDLIAVLDARPYEDALERAEATLASDQANLERQQHKLILDRDGLPAASGHVAKQQLEEQESTVAQARAALKVGQAELDSARTLLGSRKITAPFDGVAGLREVDIGNPVQPNDAHGIVVVKQIQSINAVFSLPLGDLRRFKRRLPRAHSWRKPRISVTSSASTPGCSKRLITT